MEGGRWKVDESGGSYSQRVLFSLFSGVKGWPPFISRAAGRARLRLAFAIYDSPRVTPGQRPVLGAAVTVAHCPEAAYLAEVLVHGPARFNIGRTLLTWAAPFLSEDSPYHGGGMVRGLGSVPVRKRRRHPPYFLGQVLDSAREEPGATSHVIRVRGRGTRYKYEVQSTSKDEAQVCCHHCRSSCGRHHTQEQRPCPLSHSCHETFADREIRRIIGRSSVQSRWFSCE